VDLKGTAEAFVIPQPAQAKIKSVDEIRGNSTAMEEFRVGNSWQESGMKVPREQRRRWANSTWPDRGAAAD